MKITVLSSRYYESKNKNCGDCFIIDNGQEAIIYDCGCEEHARRVIDYLEKHGYEEAKVILSHNDSDHFDGILTLIEEEKVSKVYTVLLLKYKTELLKIIDDKRKSRDSITRQITEKYSNITELGGKGLLEDIEVGKEIANGVIVIGPDKEYLLEAFAKALDTREGETIDQETIVNATSVQVEIDMDNDKLLLCGDCSFKAIEDKVENYSYIQLPHHGKEKQATKIFDAMSGKNNTVYIVSDNTGESVGGSDNLPTKGYDIRNTKKGDIALAARTSMRSFSGVYYEFY